MGSYRPLDPNDPLMKRQYDEFVDQHYWHYRTESSWSHLSRRQEEKVLQWLYRKQDISALNHQNTLARTETALIADEMAKSVGANPVLNAEVAVPNTNQPPGEKILRPSTIDKKKARIIAARIWKKDEHFSPTDVAEKILDKQRNDQKPPLSREYKIKTIAEWIHDLRPGYEPGKKGKIPQKR
jgi:hypothetical protein